MVETLVGDCTACGAVVVCDPRRVPVIRVNGERQPICRACFDTWNKIHRTDKGLSPIPLLPGAYRE